MALLVKDSVDKVHNHKISLDKKGEFYWTRVGTGRNGSKRIHAKTKARLYIKLYEYYYPSGASEEQKEAEPPEITFGEALRRWNDWNRDMRKRTDGTHDRNQYTIRFFDSIADRPIADLTTDDLRQLFGDKAPTVKYYAIKAAVQAMHNTFRWAIEHKYVSVDISYTIRSTDYQADCDSIDASDDDDDEEYDDDENGNIFSPEQINAITDHERRKKRRKPNMRAYAILFSTLTGMRIGEIAALHWSDVKWEDDYIWVHRQQRSIKKSGEKRYLVEMPYTKNEAKKPAKKRKGRRFPIYSDELRDLLEELRFLTGTEEYIFSEDGHWIDKQSFGRYLYRALKSLGLYSEDLHGFHVFRRSFNSNVLLNSSLNMAQIAYIMGHTPETNQSHYSSVRPDQVREIGREIAQTVA